MEKQLKLVYSKKEPVNKNVVWLHPDVLHNVVIKLYNNGEWTPLSVAELPDNIEQAFEAITDRNNNQDSVISELVTYSSELGETVEDNISRINEHTQSINRTAANIIALSSTITKIENSQKDISNTIASIAQQVANTFESVNTLSNEVDDISDIADNLNLRIYDLGDYTSAGSAENAVKAPSISGNNNITLIYFTVNSSKKAGLILQQVGDIRTTQFYIWDGMIYARWINFTDNTRTTLHSTGNWYKQASTHIKYDPSSRKIGLTFLGNNDINNPTETAILPLASSTQAGLMSTTEYTIVQEASSFLSKLKTAFNTTNLDEIISKLETLK